ncbi:MAG: beta-lactamase family protein [Flavobacteriaceae bacterium]|nr:beta-lactamase family protein [Muriicola sp.]NNL39250.1 beta-lactamase family protein [Flavobacteriaceae bacterium]
MKKRIEMGKYLKISLLALFIVVSVCGQSTNRIDIEIDAYLKPYLDMDAWSGIVAIYEDDKPVFQKAYGYADREWKTPNTLDTKFRIASISKLFTEVAILMLVEEGKLSLDDRLNIFIPDYPRGNEITVQQLLNHSSGIPHLNNFSNYNELIKNQYTLNEIIDLFRNIELDFDPGKRYNYSNSGYVLLAFIIEDVSGLSYEQFLEEYLFLPLHLENTGVDSQKKILPKRARGYMFNPAGELIHAEFVNMSIKIGGGSLYSTLGDLRTFLNNLLRKKILKSTLKKLPNFRGTAGNEIFSTNGRVQGFCHQITYRSAQALTIVILGNHYSNLALPISDDIYRIYSGQDYKEPVNYIDLKVNLIPENLAIYEGTYDFGFGPVGKVVVIGDHLTYLAPGREVADTLIPLGDHKFFYLQNWVVLAFKDQKEDSFVVLDWIMGENAYPAKKIQD